MRWSSTAGAVYAGCLLDLQRSLLLQQESTEEAGQRQRNSDRAPANHVLKSDEALNAGRGVVCLDLVDLRSQSGGAHISSCSDRLGVGRYTKATRRDMTLMQVCREVGSLELVRIERSINFVATDKDQKSTPCPV